ncbi:hypothetical protein [Actinoplanes sp. NPDC051851]|uniref:lipopolysaccharide biosynthesis protein n=1 Tax=Actinoplanes sp. NPDC051851 TaxID=3154753 RepID=UPI003448C307
MRGLLRRIPAAVRRDYAGTLLVHWFTLGTGLYLFHLVADRGGPAGFAYYQIARGVVSTGQPLVMAGIGTGVQRYLPRTQDTTRDLAHQALLAQTIIVVLVTAAGAALGTPAAHWLGLDGRPAVVAVLIMLGGNCVCTLTVAALRGSHQVARANVTAAVGLAAVPLIAFLFAERIDDFLIQQGAGAAVVALASALTVPRRNARPLPHPGPGEPTLTTIFAYGLRRVPADLALPALYTFPTLAVATARPGGPEAGHIGFATSAVTLICSFFGMLTPVLLPRLSQYFHRPGGDSAVSRMLTSLPLLAAGLAALPTGVFVLFAPVVVEKFLGAGFDGAVPVLRLGVLSAVPFAMYYAARPTLDALLDAVTVSKLLLGCLALEAVLTYAMFPFLDPQYAAAAGLCGAAAVLGLLADRMVARALS